MPYSNNQGTIVKGEGPLVSILILTAFHIFAFCVITFPWIFSFSDSFMADPGDGLQNYWNIWWVDFAIRTLHTNPWYSYFQFYPAGAPLVVHTLSAVNTFPAVLLSGFMNITQTHNLAVVLSFVLSGVTCGMLIRSFGVSKLGQIIGSFTFAYCAYRFAHAQGHLNLITTQWIPLFLICWNRLLKMPSVQKSLLASAGFSLVFFSDYYYAVYAALVAIVFFIFYAKPKEKLWWREMAIYLSIFTVVTLLWSLPFVIRLVQLSSGGIQQTHSPTDFSLDLASAFIPGGYWIFGEYTAYMWTTLKAGPVEGSAYLGLGSIILAMIGAVFGKIAVRERLLLLGLATTFLVFAFGPQLQVFGQTRWSIMPYTVLEKVLPILKVGGIPSRMALITSLMLAVLVGLGVQALRGKLVCITCLLAAVIVIESIPKSLPHPKIGAPKLISMMRDLPRDFAVMDVNSVGPMATGLYWQSIYQLPKWSGYISRLPAYVEASTKDIKQLAINGKWQHLCEKEGFRYLLFKKSEIPVEFVDWKPALEDSDLLVIDLGNRWSCITWQQRVGILKG